MMPYHTYEIARSRIDDARDRAGRRRLARTSVSEHHRLGHRPTGVVDAVGHGLIALGTRLVTDPADHRIPAHRRAA